MSTTAPSVTRRQRGSIRERQGATGLALEVRVKVGDKILTDTIRAADTTRAAERAARRAAEVRRTELLAEVDAGLHAGPAAGSVDDLLARWMRHNAKRWEKRTADSYAASARLYISPAIGDQRVDRITGADLDELYAELGEEKLVIVKGEPKVKPGLSPATIGKVHVVLSGAFKQAARWRLIRSSPVSDATAPSQVLRPIIPPTAAELRALIAAANEDDPGFATLLRVAADGGCRRGEIAALRWDHVDLNAGELLVDAALAHTGGAVIVKDTKTHAARRLAISAATVTALRAHRVRWAEMAMAVGEPVPDYVFASERRWGAPIQPNSITQHFARVRSRVDLDQIRFHDLRHYMATAALTAGVDLGTLKGRAGWSTLASASRYSHFTPAADRRAADLLAEALEI